MLEFIKHWHVDAVVGALILAYIGYAKVSEYRFRKRAVVANATVLKVIPHSRFTSYFVSYSLAGTSRVAEYCGLPLIREYKVGDSFDILVDGGAPPDVPVPESWHNAPGGHSGNCRLPGGSLVTFLDLIYLTVAVVLMARGFGLVNLRIGHG